ncbi:MAG: alpha/beta fold hydrolase [Pseudomonadota bacterium]
MPKQQTCRDAITRRYLHVGKTKQRVVHMYCAGAGPALFLLHPSPASGSVFKALLPLVAAHASAYAIDTPGYGFSDPLDSCVDDLMPYVIAIDDIRAALGIEKIMIYGAATGSQIAAEYAKTFPDRCHALILDSVADFPAEEYASLVDNYFTDLTPDFAGGHLARVWSMSLDTLRFFPWHMRTQSARVNMPLDDVMPIEQMALQFLQAGANYHLAYAAAFRNERATALQSLQVPTSIIRWEDSLIKAYADRFDAYEWPDHVRMCRCEGGLDARHAAIVDCLKTYARDCSETKLTCTASNAGRRLIVTSNGALSVRVSGSADSDTTTLLLHDIGSSAERACSEYLTAGVACGWIVPDLPGHGASDCVEPATDDFVTCATSSLLEMLRAFEVDRVRVVAIGESHAIALAMLANDPCITSVSLLNPLCATTPISLAASFDGHHLLRVWHQLKNRQLYARVDEDGFAEPLSGEPQAGTMQLNRQLVDLLLSANVYSDALASCQRRDANAVFSEYAGQVQIARTDGTTTADASLRTFRAPPYIKTVRWSYNQAGEGASND